jgi:fructosamine-3-kinase
MEQEIISIVKNKFREKYSEELQITNKQAVWGGCISRSVKLSTNQGDFFLKWNSSGPDDLFVREAEGLKELALADAPQLVVPKVILAKQTDETPSFLLLEFLPSGHAALEDEKLGIGLARLHRKTNKAFGFHHDNYCGSTLQPNQWNTSWTNFFGEQRILHLVNEIGRSRSLSSKEKDIYHRLVSRLPDLIPDQPFPSLVHGDLWSGNYLYTANGPALIDPAAYYADREMEFAIMTMFGGFSQTTWAAYQQEYPLNPGWEERVLLYQLYHQLNHYYLFGGSYGSQALRIAEKFL